MNPDSSSITDPYATLQLAAACSLNKKRIFRNDHLSDEEEDSYKKFIHDLHRTVTEVSEKNTNSDELLAHEELRQFINELRADDEAKKKEPMSESVHNGRMKHDYMEWGCYGIHHINMLKMNITPPGNSPFDRNPHFRRDLTQIEYICDKRRDSQNNNTSICRMCDRRLSASDMENINEQDESTSTAIDDDDCSNCSSNNTPTSSHSTAPDSGSEEIYCQPELLEEDEKIISKLKEIVENISEFKNQLTGSIAGEEEEFDKLFDRLKTVNVKISEIMDNRRKREEYLLERIAEYRERISVLRENKGVAEERLADLMEDLRLKKSKIKEKEMIIKEKCQEIEELRKNYLEIEQMESKFKKGGKGRSKRGGRAEKKYNFEKSLNQKLEKLETEVHLLKKFYGQDSDTILDRRD